MEITTTETNSLSLLKPFEIQKEELQKLVDDYKNLVVTKETYDESKKALAVMRNTRISLDKTLDFNKGICNDVKGSEVKKHKELVDIISPIESILHAGVKAIDNEKELEKKRKEEEAMKKINDRISSLSQYEMKYDNGSYTLGDHTITAVQLKVFSDEEFNAFTEDVKMEFNNIISLREEEAKKKREEEAKVEKQRLENEKESQRLEVLRKEQEQKELAFKSEQERIAKEATDRENKAKQELADQQEELRKKQEQLINNIRSQRHKQLVELGMKSEYDAYTFQGKEFVIPIVDLITLDEDNWNALIEEITPKIISHKEQAEQKRLDDLKKAEEEKAESDRLAKLRSEELRPDIEKLQDLAECFRLIPVPTLTDDKSKKIAIDVIQMTEGIRQFIVKSIENL